jgi:hypothetical protein
MWSIATTAEFTASGHLPAWADEDPSESDVPLNRLPLALADVCHRSAFDGQPLRVQSPASETPVERVLWGSIEVHPYAEEPASRVPVAQVAFVDDYWVNDLDPDDLTDLAVKLRAQADRLEHEVRPALVAARADWDAAHDRV